jgi:hypothetical protein
MMLAALCVTAYYYRHRDAESRRTEEEQKKRFDEHAEEQRQEMLSNPLALAGHALLFGTERERWRGSANKGARGGQRAMKEEEMGLSMTPIGPSGASDGGGGGYGTAPLEAGGADIGIPDEI